MHFRTHLRADLQRRRQRIVIRHRERRAVGKDTPGPAQAHLADREQVALDLELREAPGIRPQRARPPFEQRFQVAFLLLEMLRPRNSPSLQMMRFVSDMVALALQSLTISVMPPWLARMLHRVARERVGESLVRRAHDRAPLRCCECRGTRRPRRDRPCRAARATTARSARPA